jgi:hypothetical protein
MLVAKTVWRRTSQVVLLIRHFFSLMGASRLAARIWKTCCRWVEMRPSVEAMTNAQIDVPGARSGLIIKRDDTLDLNTKYDKNFWDDLKVM